MGNERIHTLFERCLQRWPQRVFLHLPDAEWSFADIAGLVDRLEGELRANEVQPGDRVLIVAENAPEHIALVLACSRLGAWSCGVNARMAPAEIHRIVQKADPRLIYFCADASATAAAHAARFDPRPSVCCSLLRSAVREQASNEGEPLASAVATVVFTSGTSGAPKGVMATHRGLMHFARVSSLARKLTPEDRVYACLPMTHIFGLGTMLLASLHAGASLVMRPKFDPQDLLDALANEQVSNVLAPPALFSRLLSHIEERGLARPQCPALRYLYVGAAPLEPTLKQRIGARFGTALHHGYGMSEYAGSLCVTSIDAPRSDTSAGRAFEGAELRIVDKDGADVPVGACGEIWFRGPGLMPGYFRDAAATREVMRPGGWCASGDIGRMDADGSLFVVGRLKEMIVRSGFNVYPAEVEEVLNRHRAIQRSAVIGCSQADGNEEIVAFVELRPGASLDRADLDAWLREHLAPYKRPSTLKTVAELPTTVSGKILKRELRTLCA